MEELDLLKKIWKLFDSMQQGIAQRFNDTVALCGEIEFESEIKSCMEIVEELKLKPLIKKTKCGIYVVIIHSFSEKILNDLGIKE